MLKGLSLYILNSVVPKSANSKGMKTETFPSILWTAARPSRFLTHELTSLRLIGRFQVTAEWLFRQQEERAQ